MESNTADTDRVIEECSDDEEINAFSSLREPGDALRRANTDFVADVRAVLAQSPDGLQRFARITSGRDSMLGSFDGHLRRAITGCVVEFTINVEFDFHAASKQPHAQELVKTTVGTMVYGIYKSTRRGGKATFVVCSTKVGVGGIFTIVAISPADFNRIVGKLPPGTRVSLDTPEEVCARVMAGMKESKPDSLLVCSVVPAGVVCSLAMRNASDLLVNATVMQITGLVQLPQALAKRIRVRPTPVRKNAAGAAAAGKGGPAAAATTTAVVAAGRAPPLPGFDRPVTGGFMAEYTRMTFKSHIPRPARNIPRHIYAQGVDYVLDSLTGVSKKDPLVNLHICIAQMRRDELRSGKPLSEFDDLTGHYLSVREAMTMTTDEAVNRTRTYVVLKKRGLHVSPFYAWAVKNSELVDGLIGKHVCPAEDRQQVPLHDYDFDSFSREWSETTDVARETARIQDDVTDDQCLFIIRQIGDYLDCGGDLADAHRFLSTITYAAFSFVTAFEFGVVRAAVDRGMRDVVDEMIQETKIPSNGTTGAAVASCFTLLRALPDLEAARAETCDAPAPPAASTVEVAAPAGPVTKMARRQQCDTVFQSAFGVRPQRARKVPAAFAANFQSPSRWRGDAAGGGPAAGAADAEDGGTGSDSDTTTEEISGDEDR